MTPILGLTLGWIAGLWAAALFEFKDRARAVLAQILFESHAALLTGILLGDDSGISPELNDAFSATGTSHIIAISGFDIRMHRICLAPHRSTQTLGY